MFSAINGLKRKFDSDSPAFDLLRKTRRKVAGIHDECSRLRESAAFSTASPSLASEGQGPHRTGRRMVKPAPWASDLHPKRMQARQNRKMRSPASSKTGVTEREWRLSSAKRFRRD